MFADHSMNVTLTTDAIVYTQRYLHDLADVICGLRKIQGRTGPRYTYGELVINVRKPPFERGWK
jgi:hypothetical protein